MKKLLYRIGSILTLIPSTTLATTEDCPKPEAQTFRRPLTDELANYLQVNVGSIKERLQISDEERLFVEFNREGIPLNLAIFNERTFEVARMDWNVE